MQPSVLECIRVPPRLQLASALMHIRIFFCKWYIYVKKFSLDNHSLQCCHDQENSEMLMAELPILVSTLPMLLKCSERLAECMLIQPMASNTIMTLNGALV
jgi:hypothetical protein